MKVDKSEGRIIIMKKIGELQDIKERYSKYPAGETIGDENYTYGDHIKYLDEKMAALVWAYDVLKAAEDAEQKRESKHPYGFDVLMG